MVSKPPGNTRIQHLLSLSRDVGPKFDSDRARGLLAEKGLAARTHWKAMSKGQQRWTLLVMLLCRGCDVLLLDEPADGLDPEARLQLYQLIRREANEQGVTALVTTHIINDIEKVTDDVCILHQGRLILHESLEDLREQVIAVELDQLVEVPDDVQVLRIEWRGETTYWLRRHYRIASRDDFARRDPSSQRESGRDLSGRDDGGNRANGPFGPGNHATETIVRFEDGTINDTYRSL